MKKKLEIIDKICERHPSYGLEKGWSEYVGGMRDTGRWFHRKMLDCSKKELQAFLDELIKKESKGKVTVIRSKQTEKPIIYHMKDGEYIAGVQFDKAYLDFRQKIALSLFFGE